MRSSQARFLETIGLVIIGLGIAYGVINLYWLLHDYSLPSVKTPIAIMNKNDEVAIGDRIEMRMVVDKPAVLKPEGSVFIECEDGNLVTMVPIITNLPVGKYISYNDKYVLPPKVAVGARCALQLKYTYQLNPIRTETLQWGTETFTVTAPRS